jgi:hypothetical protein
MSKPSRTDSMASFLNLTLVGAYIAIELLYFAHSVPMAAGLPIGLGLVWLCSDVRRARRGGTGASYGIRRTRCRIRKARC